MSRAQAMGMIVMMVLCTVYGQMIFKWRISEAGPLPAALNERILFILKLMATPWIFSSLLASVLATGFWFAAVSRLPLSEAYPWTSLSFVLVTVLSIAFFQEPLTWSRVLCVVLITAGIWVGSLE